MYVNGEQGMITILGLIYHIKGEVFLAIFLYGLVNQRSSARLTMLSESSVWALRRITDIRFLVYEIRYSINRVYHFMVQFIFRVTI